MIVLVVCWLSINYGCHQQDCIFGRREYSTTVLTQRQGAVSVRRRRHELVSVKGEKILGVAHSTWSEPTTWKLVNKGIWYDYSSIQPDSCFCSFRLLSASRSQKCGGLAQIEISAEKFWGGCFSPGQGHWTLDSVTYSTALTLPTWWLGQYSCVRIIPFFICCCWIRKEKCLIISLENDLCEAGM